ncbi:pseudouridine synthase, partial [Neoconidiobolus thromboides FSU 785]
HPDGKPSFTRFELVKFNGKSSLVKAIPKTGRTHQIRVHLFYLGFPIANDPLYKLNKDSESNNDKEKDRKEDMEVKLNGIDSKEKEAGDDKVELIDSKINKVIENNIKEKKKEKEETNEAGQEIPKIKDENNETELDQNKTDEVLPKVNNTSNLNLIKIQYMNEHTIELAKKRMQPSKINSVGWTQCDVCNNLIPPDPIVKENLIYLHAYSYKLLDYHFTTKNLPDWAKEDYED